MTDCTPYNSERTSFTFIDACRAVVEALRNSNENRLYNFFDDDVITRIQRIQITVGICGDVSDEQSFSVLGAESSMESFKTNWKFGVSFSNDINYESLYLSLRFNEIYYENTTVLFFNRSLLNSRYMIKEITTRTTRTSPTRDLFTMC